VSREHVITALLFVVGGIVLYLAWVADRGSR